MTASDKSISGGSVREVTWELLRSYGVTKIFGNPGSTEMRMFADWPGDFDYILGLQEATVVAMADGYAQRTRSPGFVNLHSAAGVGHALGNILAAYRNQTPLVVTAGQQTRAMLPSEPYLFAAEATEFPKPYVKWSVEPARPNDVPRAIAQAYHTAMTPPRGPVFVSIPEDDWDAVAAPIPEHTVVPSIGVDLEAVARFAAYLAVAENPAIVVGPAVDGDGAGEAAVALAERLRAGVYAAPWSSRCSFPERHPLFQGFLTASREAVVQQLSGHDLILAVGAQVFTYHVHTEGPFVPEGARVLHMTDNPAQAFSAVAGESLLCSMRNGLMALLERVPQSTRTPPAPWTRPEAPELSDPINAETVLAILSELMTEDTVVFEEATSFRRAIREHLPIPSPGLFYNSFSGGLGWALPASVGAALAEPSRRVLCLIGDGSSMYSIQALWTAAQHQVPLTMVVLNNGEYGALKGFLQRFGAEGFPGSDLPGLDLTAEAAGLGCQSVCVDDPARVRQTLRWALTAPGPSVVDIHVAQIRADPL